MKKHLKIWAGALIRGLIVAGITLFSTAISLGFSWNALETGLIAGGLYMFAELVKFYKISIPTAKKGNYKFLLFP